jgi:hypothetical protein
VYDDVLVNSGVVVLLCGGVLCYVSGASAVVCPGCVQDVVGCVVEDGERCLLDVTGIVCEGEWVGFRYSAGEK